MKDTQLTEKYAHIGLFLEGTQQTKRKETAKRTEQQKTKRVRQIIETTNKLSSG